MHSVLYPVVLARAVILRNDHPRAAGEAGKCAYEGIYYGGYGAYGRKCLVAHVIAHYPRIHRIIKLLKYIAHEQRYREVQKMPENAARSHIHIVFLNAPYFHTIQKTPTNRSWLYVLL